MTPAVTLALLTVLAGTADSRPCVLHAESLEYPSVAQDNLVAGSAAIEIKVGTDGRVIQTAAQSGDPILRRAAEENIRKWRFCSGEERELQVLYDFRLQEPAFDVRLPTAVIFDFPNRVVVVANILKTSHREAKIPSPGPEPVQATSHIAERYGGPPGGSKINTCIVHAESLEYPRLARNARISGVVKARIIIAEDGTVSVALLESGHELLQRAAAENIRKWRFSTGVRRETEIQYDFRLEEPPNQTVPRSIVKFDFPGKIEVVTDYAEINQ